MAPQAREDLGIQPPSSSPANPRSPSGTTTAAVRPHAQCAVLYLARGYHEFASRGFPQASWRSATDGPDVFPGVDGLLRLGSEQYKFAYLYLVISFRLVLMVILPLSAPARCRSAASIGLTASLSVHAWCFLIRTLPNRASIRSAPPSLCTPVSPACQKGAQWPTYLHCRLEDLEATMHAATARFCMGGGVLPIAPSLPPPATAGPASIVQFFLLKSMSRMYLVPSHEPT